MSVNLNQPAHGIANWDAPVNENWDTLDIVLAERENVKQYGAVGDGVTDDYAAINLAIAAVTSSFGIVYFPPGIYIISNQIIVPNKVVLIGSGRTATSIKAKSTFPTSTQLIRLGSGASIVFGCRIENMTIDGNSIANSIGVYSTDINEQSGIQRVVINNCLQYGIHIDGSGANRPAHFLLDDIEVYGNVATAGIFLNESGGGGVLRRITVNRDPNATAGKGIYNLNATTTGFASFYDLHFEKVTDGLFFEGANARGVVSNLDANNGVTNAITIDSTATGGPFIFQGIMRSGGTNQIKNDAISSNVTSNVSFYSQTSNGAGAINVSYDTNGNGLNFLKNGSPSLLVKSTQTSGSTSRVFVDLKDGNGDGWALRFGADGSADPFQLLPYTADSLGATLWQVDDLGNMGIKRARATLGTALVAGDFALSAGWGVGSTVTAVTGTDQGWQITVTAAGTPGASPTITLTFKDGTWTNAPICITKMVSGTGTVTTLSEVPTATTNVITFNGTPVAASTYIIASIAMGR